MIKKAQSYIFKFIPVKIDKINKIIVSRTDGIGDVILTLPLVDVLKKCMPDAKIDFLVNKNIAELFADYSNINKVQVIENGRFKEILSIFKGNRYDAIILAKPEFNIALAAWFAGITVRIGIAYRWYSFLFNKKHYQHRKYSIKQEAEYNLDLLKELGCNPEYKFKPTLNVGNETINKVKKYLAENKTEEKFIVIHIPTKGSAQSWKSENFITLINLLTENETFNYTICLTGKEQEQEFLKSVYDSLQNTAKVRLVYNLSLIEFTALLKLSALVVSNSTGAIHLASAVDTFVVGLYSSIKVQSAVRWGPYTDKKKVFEASSVYSLDSIKPDAVYDFIIKTLI